MLIESDDVGDVVEIPRWLDRDRPARDDARRDSAT